MICCIDVSVCSVEEGEIEDKRCRQQSNIGDSSR